MTKKIFTLFLTVALIWTNQQLRGQSGNIPELITKTISSTVLNEERTYFVQLPENYNPDNHLSYPVIYLLDGGSLMANLNTVYNNYWGHYLPHMILVGISNQDHRTRDLTTSQISSRNGAPMNQETGGAEQFLQFIEKELIPKIDDSYATTSYKTLIGHSYAGLFTINALINHQHIFNNYVAIDPSLDWDDQKLLKQAKEKLKSVDYSGKSLFVSLAAEQLNMMDEKVTINNLMQDTSEFSLFARSIVGFSTFLENNTTQNMNFSWKVYPNDLHGTVPLPSMRDGLIQLFEWYQFEDPQKYNNFDTSVEELETLLDKQEKILSKNFGYATAPMIEELFNGYGYMFLQTGQPKKAKLFFEMGIKHYPKSPNAYDSMADYYEAQEDLVNALKQVTKAFELTGDERYKERMIQFKSQE